MKQSTIYAVSESMHDLKVTFGTIAQLVLEDAPKAELEKVIRFCIEVGLPVTFKKLGIEEPTDAQLMAAATAACADSDTLHNMPFTVTPQSVCTAMKAADRYG